MANVGTVVNAGKMWETRENMRKTPENIWQARESGVSQISEIATRDEPHERTKKDKRYSIWWTRKTNI